MPTALLIKNVPDHIVQQLRARADRQRRSVQDELLAIIEAAAFDERSMALTEVRHAKPIRLTELRTLTDAMPQHQQPERTWLRAQRDEPRD